MSEIKSRKNIAVKYKVRSAECQLDDLADDDTDMVTMMEDKHTMIPSGEKDFICLLPIKEVTLLIENNA